MNRAGVVRALAPSLTANGFQKRAGGIFTLDLDQGVFGWIGINTASRSTRAGLVLVNPVVGLRNDRVWRQVTELSGWDFVPYSPPTVAWPLQDLVAHSPTRERVVGDQNSAAIADDIVSKVLGAGEPFMRECASLDGLLAALRRGYGMANVTERAIPVVLSMLGRTSEALAALGESEMRHQAHPNGSFSEFAGAFRSTVAG